VKVVVLVTKSTENLVLQFLDFLRFYMIFPKFSTRGQSLTFGFTNRSLDFTVRPLGGVHILQLSPWARPAAGDRWNPAKGGSGLAGDDEGLTQGRFEGLETAGGAPASELSGTMDGQSWELLLRWVGA
jgi:hypothetical protein